MGINAVITSISQPQTFLQCRKRITKILMLFTYTREKGINEVKHMEKNAIVLPFVREETNSEFPKEISKKLCGTIGLDSFDFALLCEKGDEVELHCCWDSSKERSELDFYISSIRNVTKGMTTNL